MPAGRSKTNSGRSREPRRTQPGRAGNAANDLRSPRPLRQRRSHRRRPPVTGVAGGGRILETTSTEKGSLMGRHAKDTGGGEFKQAPTGNHVARCIRLIDLGTQHSEYQGQPNVRNQVLISWELCNELMEEGKPYIVSHFYTNSLNEKATMRAHLEAWRGRAFTEAECKGFDLNNVLGKPCMLTVIHAPNGKAKVSA